MISLLLYYFIKKILFYFFFSYTNFDNISIIISIIHNIVSIIIMIWGVSVIKSLKESKQKATFAFYAKLKVYLIILKKQIGTPENTFLLKLYTDDIFQAKCLSIPGNIDYFVDFVNKFLDFIETCDNQIMISKKFYNNYYRLVECLTECSLIKSIHIFSSYDDNQPIIRKIEEINKIIDDLILEINLLQNTIHYDLWENSL